MLPPLQHPRAAQLFERDLAPFLSQSAVRFGRARLHSVSDGLYYHGGMVSATWGGSMLCALCMIRTKGGCRLFSQVLVLAAVVKTGALPRCQHAATLPACPQLSRNAALHCPIHVS